MTKLDSLLKLREYIDEHIAAGRGAFVPTIDRRGLSFLDPAKHLDIQFAEPPAGHTHNDGKVFIRAVF